MKEDFRVGLLTALAVVIVGVSFAFSSGNFSMNPGSLISAIFSSFSGQAVQITANVNTPSGNIYANRSQVLGVFDIRAAGIGGPAPVVLEKIPFEVTISGNSRAVSAKDFLLLYTYCVPKGNIYGYGYRYGYAGISCNSYSALSTSVSMRGDSYQATFSPNWPVYPNATYAILTFSATPYQTTAAPGKQVKFRARVGEDVIATSQQCRYYTYGYRGRYGYTQCGSIRLPVQKSFAVGKHLTVLQAYGDGYGYPKIVLPSPVPKNTPIIEVTVPQQTYNPGQKVSIHWSSRDIPMQNLVDKVSNELGSLIYSENILVNGNATSGDVVFQTQSNILNGKYFINVCDSSNTGVLNCGAAWFSIATTTAGSQTPTTTIQLPILIVPSASTSCLNLVADLSLRMSDVVRGGSDILRLQKFLNERGYVVGTPNGVFNTVTYSAVKKFQIEQKLTATGYVGVQTRERIRILTCGQ